MNKLTESDLDAQIADKRSRLPSMWDVEFTTPFFFPACLAMVVIGALLPPFLRWLP